MEYGLAFVVDDLRSLALEEPGAVAAAVYDRPSVSECSSQIPNPARSTTSSATRRASDVVFTVTPLRTKIVVLEGELDANGHVTGPGSYAHFPAGEVMRHQAAGDEPCLFVILFHGPFDIELVEAL